MSYRFQKFTTVYPDFTRQFLNENTDYPSLSYSELYERFVGSHYGWANYYAKNLNNLGVQAEDLFVDIEPLQKAWAREHGVEYSRDNWQRDIMLAQVKSFRPDVLYLQDLYYFDASFRKQLREICGKRLLMLGWQAAPIQDYAVLRDLDVVLTCAPHFAEFLNQAGANGVLFLHAFESSILSAIRPAPRNLDFTFIGSFVLRDGFHHERYEMVQTLFQSTPLQVWGYVSVNRTPSKPRRLLSKAAAIANRLPAAGKLKQFRNGFASNSPRQSIASEADLALQDRFHKPVFGLRYYEILASSKVTFNNHIDCAEQYAGNMRLFEATGAGACLVTDRKHNLAEMFEPDVEVVTYGSVEECAEKVRYLLEHDSEREAIAAAGQRRVLRDHTFEKRAKCLDEIIRQALK
jgi:spore maturation protein CgeB